MEPNKLENDFKNKLNQRSMQPTEMAWDRLDAMLTVAEAKKTKSTFGWLYIAASFLGFILIATVFFSQSTSLIDLQPNTVVVKNQVKNDTLPKITLPINQQPVLLPSKKNETATTATSNKTPKNHSYKVELLPVNGDKNNQNQITQVAITATKTSNQSDNLISSPKPASSLKETLSNPKSIHVNVDALLASVEKSPKAAPLFDNQTSIKVNPSSFLSQVDGELELSFREKVIQSVNKNYRTVKVALSNRNNQ